MRKKTAIEQAKETAIATEKETATGFATSHCQSVGHKIGREKL